MSHMTAGLPAENQLQQCFHNGAETGPAAAALRHLRGIYALVLQHQLKEVEERAGAGRSAAAWMHQRLHSPAADKPAQPSQLACRSMTDLSCLSPTAAGTQGPGLSRCAREPTG